jgi:hypothetical protein
VNTTFPPQPAAVLPSKLDNIGGETLLVLTAARDLALRRAMLPERRTGARSETSSCARTCSMQYADARGLEVSPGGLLQNELVQCQIRETALRSRLF